MIDRQLRAEIIAEVGKVTREAYETYNEKWLKASEVAEYISVMTSRWLESHGDMLPRTAIEWDDKEGHHITSYMYPLHRLQAMMQDGRIKELKAKA
jgi:hypothetical protein